MKKIGTLLLGIAIGAGLMVSPNIYGAGAKLMGKEVDKQMEVKLDDTVIGQAAVIEGTSYIPIRAFANQYNLGIDVDATTITLTSPSSEESDKIAKEQQDVMDKAVKASDLKSLIEKSKRDMTVYEQAITDNEKRSADTKVILDDLISNNKGDQVTRDSVKQTYDRAVAAVESNKALLAKEQANLADLEAQLAALQQK